MQRLTNITFCYKILWVIAKLMIITFKSQMRRIGDFKMFETLKNILMEELQVKEDVITLDAELASDLGINSIELADLVMLCEEKFDLTIEDEDLHSFITVGDVVEYLENHA